MSEPAKSANEIEDVLSSIRRLVSEGKGNAAPSRLVLTPAQRVVEPDDPWAPVPDATASAGAGSADPAWGLEDRLSDWGEIEGSGQEAVEEAMAEQSVAVPPGPADAIGVVVALSGDAGDAGPDQPGFEAETGDTNWPDAGASRALRDLALVRGQPVPDAETQAEASEPTCEGMAAMGEGDARPHNDVAEGPAQAAEAPEAMSTDDSAADGDTPDAAAPQDAATDAAQGEVAADGMAETQPVAETEGAADAEDVAEVAAEAEAEAKAKAKAEAKESPRMFSRPIRRNPEPVTGADADSDMDEDDDLDVEDLGDDPQPFSFPETEDGILDEETLRQIVADVVRAELQGVLGQRITRNVRKMVRREVRLALAAQELE